MVPDGRSGNEMILRGVVRNGGRDIRRDLQVIECSDPNAVIINLYIFKRSSRKKRSQAK
jgi:hypothetical protein